MDFRETFDYVCRPPATPAAVEQNDAANPFDIVTGAVVAQQAVAKAHKKYRRRPLQRASAGLACAFLLVNGGLSERIFEIDECWAKGHNGPPQFNAAAFGIVGIVFFVGLFVVWVNL
jgi:hypothetical protein